MQKYPLEVQYLHFLFIIIFLDKLCNPVKIKKIALRVLHNQNAAGVPLEISAFKEMPIVWMGR